MSDIENIDEEEIIAKKDLGIHEPKEDFEQLSQEQLKEIVDKVKVAEKQSHIRVPPFFIDKWVRFPQYLNFGMPFRAVISGMTGTGKSALVEELAVMHDRYNNHNGKIIDVYGASDMEALGWCRHNEYKNNILFLHGDSVKISSQWDHKKASEVTLDDFKAHKVIISVPAFYSSTHEEMQCLGRFIGIIKQRTHYEHNQTWFVAVREGTSLLYSRISLGDNAGQAKAAFIFAIKEMRHSGCSIALDIIRYLGLDIEVRSLADFLFIKAVGIAGLPDDLGWVYGYYDLFVDLIKMPEWAFIIATGKGGLGHGHFALPYWHKDTREDLLSLFNIETKYSDTIKYAEESTKAVSDFEHADIMRLRLAKGIGTTKLSKGGSWDLDGKVIRLPQRSSKTVYRQIEAHNVDITASGHCAVCHRLDLPELSRMKDTGVHG